MKVTIALPLISGLCLVAGCNYEDRPSSYNTSEPAYSGSRSVISSSPTYDTSRDVPVVTAPTTPRSDTYTSASQGAAATSQLITDADRALANEVRQQFTRYPDVAGLASNLGVSARNGVVTLSGSVPYEQDRANIENAVRNTPGVTRVIDQIQIVAPTVGSVQPTAPAPAYSEQRTYTSQQPTGRYDQDARIYASNSGDVFSLHVQGLNEPDRAVAQRILEGLRTDSVLPSLLPVVNIDVNNGRVVLRGMVQSDAQRRTIVAAVQRAAGVGNVYDELQIQPPR